MNEQKQAAVNKSTQVARSGNESTVIAAMSVRINETNYAIAHITCDLATLIERLGGFKQFEAETEGAVPDAPGELGELGWAITKLEANVRSLDSISDFLRKL